MAISISNQVPTARRAQARVSQKASHRDRADARAQPMAALRRYRCAATLRGHTNDARRRRPADTRLLVDVYCVAVLSNDRVVSGSSDNTLKVWDASTSECLRTLSGHTSWARRRRPAAPRVDRSSTPRWAQVYCVAVLSNGRLVSGSWDGTLKVWDPSSGRCLRTLRGHMGSVRRWRPVEPRVDCSSTP